MDFRENAIKSAQIYYNFLSNSEKKGMVTYGVVKKIKCDSYFEFYINSKINMPESIQVSVNGKCFEYGQIRPFAYDEVEKKIKIKVVDENCQEEIDNARPENIILVSDLRFLVKRVEDWYREFGDYCAIPNMLPPKGDCIIDTESVSDEQLNAAKGIFSNPFTYIWGAPGTGKTKFVLAQCVMRYIKNGKKVLLVAPTNNAVEQSLYGLISMLEKNHISRRNILRLGVASAEFVKRYPDICEDSAISKEIDGLKLQIKAIEDDVKHKKEIKKKMSKAKNYKQFCDDSYSSREKLPSLLAEKLTLQKSAAAILAAIQVNNGYIKSLKDELEKLGDEKKIAGAEIQRLQDKIEKYEKSNGLYRRLHKKSHTQDESDFKNKNVENKGRDDKIAECDAKKSELLKRLDSLNDERDDIKNKISEKSKQIEQFSSYNLLNDRLKKYVKDIDERDEISEIEHELEKIYDEDDNTIKAKESKYSEALEYINVDLDALISKRTEQLRDLSVELEEANKRAAAQTSDRLVWATTIDTILARVVPDGDFKPQHIFLDEAGYCSLIKGAALTAYDCPVTLLGDHMQLPPVCEMGDITEHGNELVSLWDQSALYIEDILTDGFNEFYKQYCNRTQPRFEQLKKFNLTKSYRFSDELAKVLEEDIYTEGFAGDKNNRTEIFYIDVPKENSSGEKRVSTSESAAIIKYLKQYGCDNVGIITPYKNQMKYIHDAIEKDTTLNKTVIADDVMTVHRSQGREWDTVIFSVVDKTDKYFTDSTKATTNGKKVINTAVSRTRKKLIIVCDASEWLNCKQQLISKIMRTGEKMEI